MPTFTSGTRLLAGGIMTAFVCAALTAAAVAQHTASTPDFFSNDAAWVAGNVDYRAVPGMPGPTRSDPAHPYVPNGTGAQPTFRVADLTDPNLKPWAKEIMKRENQKVLAGGIGYTARSSCMPAGVPTFVMYAVFEPIHFVQTPKQVTMIFSGDAQVRRIYLDVPHSANPKPSWYGESVGRYEGDTLVIDTIGFNDKTFIDNFRTPHSEKLHLIERLRLVEGDRFLEAEVVIEDPAVFLKPLHVTKRSRRVEATLAEWRCAAGEMNNPFANDADPLPMAAKSDF